MPSRTAISRSLTRLAPGLTIHILCDRASRSTLIGLLLLSASACGSDAGLTPTPLTPTPASQPSASTGVTIEGRVLDEHNQPVEGARISPLYMPGGPAPGTTADQTGGFSLTVDWPSHWPGITLRADRDGYESADMPVQATGASAVLINMYKSLTISPAKTIQATLSFPSGDCGLEPLCRRATVNAPSGKPVDIEVMAADGQEYVGLALRDELIWGRTFPSRLTAPGGAEVWIFVRQPGRVTVVAAER